MQGLLTMKKPSWTQEEIEYLQEWAEHLPAEQIAKKLKKTTAQIEDKAHHLGINIKPIYDYWSAGELARLLDISYSIIATWVRRKELIANKSRNAKNSHYRISRKNFKAFYLKYKNEKVCFRRVNQESLNWILND
jgi:hypothetical protein